MSTIKRGSSKLRFDRGEGEVPTRTGVVPAEGKPLKTQGKV